MHRFCCEWFFSARWGMATLPWLLLWWTLPTPPAQPSSRIIIQRTQSHFTRPRDPYFFSYRLGQQRQFHAPTFLPDKSSVKLSLGLSTSRRPWLQGPSHSHTLESYRQVTPSAARPGLSFFFYGARAKGCAKQQKSGAVTSLFVITPHRQRHQGYAEIDFEFRPCLAPHKVWMTVYMREKHTHSRSRRRRFVSQRLDLRTGQRAIAQDSYDLKTQPPLSRPPLPSFDITQHTYDFAIHWYTPPQATQRQHAFLSLWIKAHRQRRWKHLWTLRNQETRRYVPHAPVHVMANIWYKSSTWGMTKGLAHYPVRGLSWSLDRIVFEQWTPKNKPK